MATGWRLLGVYSPLAEYHFIIPSSEGTTWFPMQTSLVFIIFSAWVPLRGSAIRKGGTDPRARAALAAEATSGRPFSVVPELVASNPDRIRRPMKAVVVVNASGPVRETARFRRQSLSADAGVQWVQKLPASNQSKSPLGRRGHSQASKRPMASVRVVEGLTTPKQKAILHH